LGIDEGLSGWRSQSNHNKMVEYQKNCESSNGNEVEITYFGSSAFKITTPAGITLMIDPWRNLPTGTCDWFYHDFPPTKVDIGASTHSHFDHDALHRLDASVLLDRLIGAYEFGDLKITGIADKHAVDATYAPYDFHKINHYFGGNQIVPPDNARSWDNCMLLIETGNIRILHWGDNRHNPPSDIWDKIGDVDILLLPIDDSQHVLGNPMADQLIDRLEPNVMIPHHYYIWNIVQRQSTLFPANEWLKTRKNVCDLGRSSIFYTSDNLPQKTTVHSFGNHVGFDVREWHEENGRFVNNMKELTND
jgi:L-ascorbate metabolism protein UlaG (beta-lactamase superfamily)